MPTPGVSSVFCPQCLSVVLQVRHRSSGTSCNCVACGFRYNASGPDREFALVFWKGIPNLQQFEAADLSRREFLICPCCFDERLKRGVKDVGVWRCAVCYLKLQIGFPWVKVWPWVFMPDGLKSLREQRRIFMAGKTVEREAQKLSDSVRSEPDCVKCGEKTGMFICCPHCGTPTAKHDAYERSRGSLDARSRCKSSGRDKRKAPWISAGGITDYKPDSGEMGTAGADRYEDGEMDEGSRIRRG